MTVVTKWGSARVEGRLGQAHVDVLEAIFYLAEGFQQRSNGSLDVLIDPHVLRSTVGGHCTEEAHGPRRDKRASAPQLQKLLKELMRALITLKFTIQDEQVTIIGHIIDELRLSSRMKSSRATNFGRGAQATRNLLCVTFSPSWMKLLAKDIPLQHDPRPVIALRHGITQSVARHVRSHSRRPTGGWKLDPLIEAIAGPSSPAQMKNYRRLIRADAEGLRAMGLELSMGRLLPVSAASARDV
ncbi:ABC transporter ATPase [Luteimonas sp. MJ246]|uniref:ABC transporter ATPase n=1 Tax=Luteimonas sp. MJ174 TaxID=3129237 RepID=UPI0031BA89F0